MKLLITIFIVLTTLLACKKNDSNPDSLIGSWRWVATYNDTATGALNPLTPANSGHTQALIYNIKSWTYFYDSVIVAGGTYGLNVTSTNTGKKVNAIHYYNTRVGSDSISYYTIEKDTLTFSNTFIGAVGASSTKYVRQ